MALSHARFFLAASLLLLPAAQQVLAEANTTDTANITVTREASSFAYLLSRATWGYEPLSMGSGLVAVAGVLRALHTQLQRFLVVQAGFSAFTYVVLVGIFCWTMFWSLNAAVFPLTGLAHFFGNGAETLPDACFLLRWYGPVSILSILFISTILLFTPLVLLPPCPRLAESVLTQWEQQLGLKQASLRADRVDDAHIRWFMRVYILILVFELVQAPFVYSYVRFHEDAMQYQEQLAQTKVNEGRDWIHQHFGVNTSFGEDLNLTPYEALRAQGPAVTAVAISFLYLVLIWAEFIIVYDRMTRRSFQEDFPYIMAVRAFPFLLRFKWVAGTVTAQWYKLCKSTHIFHAEAEKAFELLSRAPPNVQAASKNIEAGFAAAEEQIRSIAFEAEAQLRREETIAEAAFKQLLEKIFDDIDNAVEPGIVALAQQLGTNEQAAFFDEVYRVNHPNVDQSTRGGTEEVYGNADEDDRDEGEGLVPGAPDFAQRLPALVKEELQHLRHLSLSLAGTALKVFKGDAEQLISDLRDAAIKELRRVRRMVLVSISAALAEVKDLAYQSSKLKGVIDATFAAIRSHLSDVSGDIQEISRQATHLVDEVMKLPCVRSKCWVVTYAVIGVWAITVALVAFVMVISTVFRFWSLWHGWQRTFGIVSILPFVGIMFFIMQFWFLAVTGRLEDQDSWLEHGALLGNAAALPNISQGSQTPFLAQHPPRELDEALDLEARDVRCCSHQCCARAKYILMGAAFVVALLAAIALAASGVDAEVCQGP
mmetsp:Transcript_87142/g.244461  ORF Transcript_87142/g.244461 Transcript_87142/m.244461 type:complete len:767 (-) Transcript_87142:219-2519(-)